MRNISFSCLSVHQSDVNLQHRPSDPLRPRCKCPRFQIGPSRLHSEPSQILFTLLRIRTLIRRYHFHIRRPGPDTYRREQKYKEIRRGKPLSLAQLAGDRREYPNKTTAKNCGPFSLYSFSWEKVCLFDWRGRKNIKRSHDSD